MIDKAGKSIPLVKLHEFNLILLLLDFSLTTPYIVGSVARLSRSALRHVAVHRLSLQNPDSHHDFLMLHSPSLRPEASQPHMNYRLVVYSDLSLRQYEFSPTYFLPG